MTWVIAAMTIAKVSAAAQIKTRSRNSSARRREVLPDCIILTLKTYDHRSRRYTRLHQDQRWPSLNQVAKIPGLNQIKPVRTEDCVSPALTHFKPKV